MKDLGTELREARQRRGLTVEELAASTRLSRSVLDDIEHNRFDRLPHGLLGRAQVRTYARALDVDAEAAVSAYVQQRFGAEDEVLPFAREAPPVVADARPGRALALEAAVVALALTLVYAYHRSGNPVRTAAPATTASAQASAPAAPPAVVSDEVEGAAASPEAAAATLRLEVRPDGPCWIEATADNEVVIYRLMQKGEVAVASAQDEIVVRVGDPATFKYWINGTRGRPLGQAARPVTVHITQDNYQMFLGDTVAERDEGSPTSAPGSPSI
jgi:cytoskeleton protein RodZ